MAQSQSMPKESALNYITIIVSKIEKVPRDTHVKMAFWGPSNAFMRRETTDTKLGPSNALFSR